MHGLPPHQAELIAQDKAAYPERHLTPHVVEQRKQQKLLRDRLKLSLSRWAIMRADADSDDAADDEDDCDNGDRETTAQMLARGATVEEIRAAKTIDEVLAEGIDAASAAEIFDVEPESIIDEAERIGLEPEAGDTRVEGLPNEEAKVAKLAKAGLSKPEIADMLDIPLQRVAAMLKPADPAKKTRAKVAAKKKRAKARTR
jgi:hypothetical protein